MEQLGVRQDLPQGVTGDALSHATADGSRHRPSGPIPPRDRPMRLWPRPEFLAILALGLGVFSATPSTADPVTPAASTAPDRPVITLAITQMASPNQDDRPAGAAIDCLVIHDTETPNVTEARTIAAHFVNPRSQVSAHYIIGKKGEIIQCVPDARRAWHAGPSRFEGRDRVNDFSIGIELVNAQTGSDPFTDAQYASLNALSADLVARYGIPLARITGHRHVTNYPGIKHDPADNFDWQRYMLGLAETLGTKQVVRAAPPRTGALRPVDRPAP